MPGRYCSILGFEAESESVGQSPPAAIQMPRLPRRFQPLRQPIRGDGPRDRTRLPRWQPRAAELVNFLALTLLVTCGA